MTVLPVAGLLAETIMNVFADDSVSAIFGGDTPALLMPFRAPSLLYGAIGLIVAFIQDYFDNLGTIARILTAILAAALAAGAAGLRSACRVLRQR